MYSNLKIAKNLDNLDNAKEKQETKYIFVNNLENGFDILIYYYGFDNKNTKYFKICNEKLIGKEYFILNFGNQILYYDNIQENTNLFPRENLPIYLLKCHRIIFLIKNVDCMDNDKFELLIKNKYSNDSFENLNLDGTNDFIDLDWKTDKNDEKNLLRIHKEYGMIGTSYYNKKYSILYSYLKEYSEQNSIKYELSLDRIQDFYTNIIYNPLSFDFIIISNISNTYDVKIKKFINVNKDNKYKNQSLVNYLNCYSIDRFFDDNLLDKFDIIIDDIYIKMQHAHNNIYEHIFIGDAIENLFFYCNSKITKIQLNIYDREDKNIVNIYDLPFEKTNFGYKIYKEDTFLCFVGYDCQIIVYSNNNSPIFIKYNTCCFGRELRKNIAGEQVSQKIIILSKYGKLDYLSYKEKYIENLIRDENIYEFDNKIIINNNMNIIL
jgi:hypothetical protein